MSLLRQAFSTVIWCVMAPTVASAFARIVAFTLTGNKTAAVVAFVATGIVCLTLAFRHLFRRST